MRKLVFVAVLLLGFCAVSVAQDVPQFEVFGGWNIVLPEGDEMDYLNGWEGAFTVNANEYAGVVIDISGQYYSGEESVSFYSFLFGPQVKLPGNEKVVPFVRALFGATHVAFEDNIMNENGFTMAIGGGVDINYNDMISIRPAQIEYITYRFDGEFYDSARFGAGIIIKIGER
ncbi:MAG: hypothetical protein JXR49_21425 [Acidobacteria bacterium]|nr:hypothetical protein [Acidobacteriota bacterium]